MALVVIDKDFYHGYGEEIKEKIAADKMAWLEWCRGKGIKIDLM